jgi:hypothetical protein
MQKARGVFMSKQPEKKFSAGAINATIWNNEGENKKGEKVNFQTIALQRVYQDKEGNWQNTASMRINDLPKAVLVLNKAYEYCLLRKTDNSSDYNNYKEDEQEDVKVEKIK